jgi:HAD domain in Swiss Army Knife RNA repair proteins
MKVLFLDIDGVVFSLNTMRKSFASGKHDDLNFAREQMEPLFRRLARVEPGLQLVISSSWRKIHSRAFIRDKLTDAGIFIPMHFNWRTDSVDTEHIINDKVVNRGIEIQAWLANNPVKKFAIVDDDGDMLDHQLPHFVHVENSDTGLQNKHVDQLIDILRD